jgi:hypothetical protein
VCRSLQIQYDEVGAIVTDLIERFAIPTPSISAVEHRVCTAGVVGWAGMAEGAGEDEVRAMRTLSEG